MKRAMLLFIFASIMAINLFSMQPPKDPIKGLILYSSFSYDKVFNSDDAIFTINVLQFALLPSSELTIHMGYLTQFSPSLSVFDIYLGLGLTYYPFEKIFCISGNFYYGLSLFLLNHFSYILDLKANFDIPIYKLHYITIGAGLRHRNALGIINYFNLGDDYFNIHNCYTFEIGYKLLF